MLPNLRQSWPLSSIVAVSRLRDVAVGRNALREPDVAAHGRAFADGDSPQHGCARINDDVVFDDGVARDALGQIAVLVGWEAFRPQRDGLINPDAFADDAGFPNHDPRAVVDEEAAGDGGAGVNVDAGVRVRDFGN